MTPMHEWNSEHEREGVRYVACDLVTFIQYLLTVLIFMWSYGSKQYDELC